jgi:hypothetical protein
MADIRVKLRIVGLYFNTTVTLDDAGSADGVTIQQVMDAYKNANPITAPGGMEYMIQTGSGLFTPNTMLSISHNYPGRYDFDGDGSIQSNEAETLGNNVRSKGIYTLTEIPLPYGNGVVAWQYYVEDAAGKLVSSTSAPADFESFTQYKVTDGQKVTWRQVAILRGPNEPSPS